MTNKTFADTLNNILNEAVPDAPIDPTDDIQTRLKKQAEFRTRNDSAEYKALADKLTDVEKRDQYGIPEPKTFDWEAATAAEPGK